MPLRRLTPNARVLLSLLALLALFIGIPLLLHAVVPGWWEEKHVYQYESGTVADASDFSAANQGQLKNMAVAAYEYLLGKIPARQAIAFCGLPQCLRITTPPPTEIADYIPQQKGSFSSRRRVDSAVTWAVPVMVGAIFPVARSSQR